jgi:putative Mg2+ transporter-C (MgtC) family protein
MIGAPRRVIAARKALKRLASSRVPTARGDGIAARSLRIRINRPRPVGQEGTMGSSVNPIHWLSTESLGQTVTQLGELTLALILSSFIGLEREIRMKSAGLRTHTLVGVASALLMLISKYGFGDVIVPNQIVLDPSRVAAQIVSGIGFIGGGLIFVQRDMVRGLTTAAAVWLTAAVGMACGAGLPILALYVTGAHFLVMVGFGRLTGQIMRADQCDLLVHYLAGQGAVREIFKLCTGRAFSVHEVAAKDDAMTDSSTHAIQLRLRGRGNLESLVLAIRDLRGVISVHRFSNQYPKE